MQKIYMIIAIISALLANVFGAFGSHALKGKIDASSLAIFQTAVQYHFYYSLALFLLALLMFHIKNQWLMATGLAFITGIFLFSGSLYLLSITNIKWIGILTPFGGLSFIIAWLLLLTGILKTKF